jgi:beta-1,4-galactosyltransferase 2
MQKEKLSIVVPYRDRENHLKQFVPHMENTLYDQKIPFEIIIVEQDDNTPFNRAKLLNIGFKETEHCDYFCFHDVDMLAVRSDYSYVKNPTHMATEAEQFGYKLPYQGYFGGVTMFDKKSFELINGFSNLFFGWGGEDDALINRCLCKKIPLSRRNCRYRSLVHDRHMDPVLYANILEHLTKNETTFKNDEILEGLSTLEYVKTSEENITKFTRKIKCKIYREDDGI